ncbi:MAG: radical SAM protein [Anaerolineae bacterium]|nr:radical SAM protein [Anaerolineae bacterium]
MIRAIEAQTLLAHVKQPDTWFGLRYNMNLYRGCQHQCIYCDSRSACYQIENFRDVLVKTNAIDLLRHELARKRHKGTIGFGSMSDTYGPVERRYKLTAQALSVIAEFGFPIHIITKSDLVTRDIEVLQAIHARTMALITFTITTADDNLARIVEPGAPVPSQRFAALRQLAGAGIRTGVTLMPLLPFIQDNAANVTQIVESAAAHGAEFILPSFGMTLRDRQRVFYYYKLDQHFPDLREQYVEQFGERYFCPVNDADALYDVFHAACARHGIANEVPQWTPPPQAKQLALF